MDEEDAPLSSPSPAATISTEMRNVAATTTENKSRSQQVELIRELADKLRSGDGAAQIQAAREVRKLIRKSSSPKALRVRLANAGVIPPLVWMLRSTSSFTPQEAALLALLNLAARNERNKVSIVAYGAIPYLVELLKNAQLKELATATILTLSSAAANKATLAISEVPPLLVQMLCSGCVQGKVDAVTALYNISCCDEEYELVLIDARAVNPLIDLLKECKKRSKLAEKATALIKILCKTDDGRVAIKDEEDGILTLVETIEDGSPASSENAVGALLSLCENGEDEYRELILGAGAIPGLLRLTAEGTPDAQENAQSLLDWLRETDSDSDSDCSSEENITAEELERVLHDITTQVDATDGRSAKTVERFLEDVVRGTEDLSMSRIRLVT